MKTGRSRLWKSNQDQRQQQQPQQRNWMRATHKKKDRFSTIQLYLWMSSIYVKRVSHIADDWISVFCVLAGCFCFFAWHFIVFRPCGKIFAFVVVSIFLPHICHLCITCPLFFVLYARAFVLVTALIYLRLSIFAGLCGSIGSLASKGTHSKIITHFNYTPNTNQQQGKSAPAECVQQKTCSFFQWFELRWMMRMGCDEQRKKSHTHTSHMQAQTNA